MRLGVVCEALTDQDGFAWTTSIMDETVWYLAFPYQELPNPSSIVCWMPRKWVPRPFLFTSAPNKNSQAYTETVLVASHSQSSYIQRISAQLPMLILIDLIYAYFLEINRDSKEKIFNSYWENKKLNGYRRQKRVRKS